MTAGGAGHARWGFALAAVILVADQVTKWIILNDVMAPPRVIEVTEFFNLVLVWNQGVSFGMFGDGGDTQRWVLIGVALAISLGLSVWLLRVGSRWVGLALGAIIGGAIGNVIDRFAYGAVADFLDFHVAGYHWPAFNVADSAITLGVVALLLDGVFGQGAERAAAQHKEAEQ